MRKILYIIPLFILAFAFTGSPPGWYQQTLPVNDFVNDIVFTDTLNGWIVTDGSATTDDTSYILHTTNGGDNWVIQNTKIEKLNVIQFLDENTGYAGGGLNGTTNISFYKTTNSGNNWITMNNLGSVIIQDMQFINKDIGWICDYIGLNAGVFKTTNGGISWIKQLNYNATNGSYYRLFFLNKDTGWVGTRNAGGYLYRTTNGGTNWNLQYSFSQMINDIHFFNDSIGITTGGSNYRTTNGGFTWLLAQGNVGGGKISMGTDYIGWAGGNIVQRISATTNGGISWGLQEIFVAGNKVPSAINGSTVWVGGGGNGIIAHTTDGGGPISNIQQISNELPADFQLYQNYPNPFNPSTNIKFKVQSSKNIKLSIFDISGKEIATLVNEKLSAGEYQYTFNAGNYSSGIYFYSLFADGNRINTRKMVLVK